LQLIDPIDRCQRCFCPKLSHHRCHSGPLKAIATCFEDAPVVRALFSLPEDTLSSFVLLQFLALRWPMPDLIIPTPGDWFSERSDHASLRKAVARHCSKILARPYLAPLRLRRSFLPTWYMSLEEQPHRVPIKAICVHHREAIVNKRILLIHDTMTTGTALRRSATALLHCGAIEIWGMSIVSSS
jgi:predicted amidophosphoribosyltransferase